MMYTHYYIHVVHLPISTEDLKIALRAESKGWKVLFARNMNTKYLTLMDKIMEMMEDYSKRLSRPVKDLDDVRQAMATLKEVRENEIFIDSSLDPIEVKLTLHGLDSVLHELQCFDYRSLTD